MKAATISALVVLVTARGGFAFETHAHSIGGGFYECDAGYAMKSVPGGYTCITAEQAAIRDVYVSEIDATIWPRRAWSRPASSGLRYVAPTVVEQPQTFVVFGDTFEPRRPSALFGDGRSALFGRPTSSRANRVRSQFSSGGGRR